MLTGRVLSEEDEEKSAFEIGGSEPRRIVRYNPAIPVESFDLIITDECHRSIYGTWRQVLEYFDAFIVGLTATPSLHTMGFFGSNLVAQYPYERSVADGVNVPYEIFRIRRTDIGEHGGAIPKGYEIPVRDKRTRAERYEELDQDLAYTAQELDRSVVVPNQICTVLEAYRDSLFTEVFPGRSEVPKTLIFCKDDHHAEEVVGIAREVFGRGNDFAKKITYKTDGADPEQLIRQFRTDYNPRIAVTVDMIATGTDVKPLEVLIFLRDVKSALYFEQMKGRGARTITPTQLRQVTPDAEEKTRFVLVDAIGVSESLKHVAQPLDRERKIGFDRLIDDIAAGRRGDDAVSTLAARLAALDRKIDDKARADIARAAGLDPRALAHSLLDAIDPDTIEREAGARQVTPEAASEALKEKACRPFDNPDLRRLLKDIKRQTEIRIDEISTDLVISSGCDATRAQDTTERFRQFLAEHRDTLVALQILYARPHITRRLDRAAIEELRDAMRRPPWLLEPVDIWRAYKRLEDDRVKGNPIRALSDIVMLVRYALGELTTLEPLPATIAGRFNLWLGREERAGRTYTEAQRAWLSAIRDFIAVNVDITPEDLMNAPDFAAQGGLLRAHALFGDRLRPLLDELPQVLIA